MQKTWDDEKALAWAADFPESIYETLNGIYKYGEYNGQNGGAFQFECRTSFPVYSKTGNAPTDVVSA